MGRLHVLLFGDDPGDSQGIESRLMARGTSDTQVVVARTAAGFLDLARSQPFDCVVVEDTVPDCPADQLLEAAEEHLHACPAVVISDAGKPAIDTARSGGGNLIVIPRPEALVGNALLRRVELAAYEARRKRSCRRLGDRPMAELLRLSETDRLTGLANRRYLDRLIEETPAADRRRGRACVLVDIDQFKRVNDRYGCQAGDEILVQVADSIRRNLSPGDVAMRWGGEEFLIVRPSESLGESWIWAERLLHRIRSEPFSFQGQRVRITMSAGLIRDPDRRLSLDLVGHADEAMGLAKGAGCDCAATAEMTFVHRLLRGYRASGRNPIQRAWLDLLEDCKPILGPTQSEHVLEHCQLVSTTAAGLAHSMGMSAAQVEQLYEAGYLHDVGKILIPEDLLAKPSALTPEESGIVAKHVPFGSEISRALGATDEVSDLVEQHHDPLSRDPSAGARILSVADAWVALTSARSYRGAQGPEHALDALLRETGIRYDPHIVEHMRQRELARKAA